MIPPYFFTETTETEIFSNQLEQLEQANWNAAPGKSPLL